MARFKKGSAQAKAWGRKMKRLRNSSSKSTSPKRRTAIKKVKKSMVRRRYPKAKRKTTRKKKGLFGMEKYLAPAMYGASREKISNWLLSKGLTQKIPGGAASDEIAMFMAAWAGKKFLFKQKSVLRDALTAGQNIEMARIGEAFVNGQINLGALTSGTSNNGSGAGFGR